MNVFEINGSKIDIEIINDRKLKNTYIRIKDNKLIIKGKNITVEIAKEIINKKSDWIAKHLEKIKNKSIIKGSENTLEKISLFGKTYDVEIIEKSITRDVAIYFNGKFLIFINPYYRDNKEIVLSSLSDFYRKISEIEIPNHVIKWAKIMNVSFKKIIFKKMKRTWGSCSHDNNLCFNIKLASLSQNQIDYIIVHELAHIKEKNHSKDFWCIVDKYISDRKNIHQSIMINLD